MSRGWQFGRDRLACRLSESDNYPDTGGSRTDQVRIRLLGRGHLRCNQARSWVVDGETHEDVFGGGGTGASTGMA